MRAPGFHWFWLVCVVPACHDADEHPGPLTPCPAGSVRCQGECVPPDSATCDSCTGPACDAGAGNTCTGELTSCGEVCVDLAFDPDHCGECDRRCAETQVCDGTGQCGATCAGGQDGGSDLERCGRSCVDIMVRQDHCGACDVSCGSDGVCEGGVCACPNFDLVLSEPALHALAASTTDDVAIELSCPADVATLNEGAHIFASATGLHSFQAASLPPREQVLSPDAPFSAGERVRVSLSSSVKSVQGRGLRRQVLDFFTATAESSATFDLGESLGAGAGFLAVAELSGDDKLDIVIASGDGTPARVLVGVGSGFEDTAQRFGRKTPARVHVADVDGDGDQDVVQVIIGQNVELWLNDGHARFTESPAGFFADNLSDVVLADFDADGNLDLFSVHSLGPSHLYLNHGRAEFEDSGQDLRPGNGVAVASADLTGDGSLDVVVVADGDPTQVWLNQGAGTFTASSQELDFGEASELVLADYDEDGNADALVAGSPSRLWLNDGKGQLSVHPDVLPKAATLVTGDFDGDGHLDAWLSHREGDALLMGRSGPTFTPSSLPSTTLTAALGDLDGDARLDLVGITSSKLTRVWTNR